METKERSMFIRFLFVIRQACLMIAAWIESETNTKQKGMSEMRFTTDPFEAPLQFRSLTEEELDAIADRITKRVLTRID